VPHDLPPDTIEDARPAQANPRTLTQWMYGLFFIGVVSSGLFGLASVAAVVLAYLKRDELFATIYASHADWIIRTFWWGLLWLVLSAIATLIFIGWVTGLLALVWMIYRLIKGWLALQAEQTPVAEF